MKVVMALLLALLAVSPAHAGAVKPDIVVVMVDDLGYIADQRIVERLPNINRIFVQGGMRFDSYYGETSWCCPGRANFLSGQHTRTHGVTHLDARLFDPTNTIATALHDAGYYTMLAGKYMNHSDLLADRTPPGWDSVLMSHGSSRWSINSNAIVTKAGSRDRQLINVVNAEPIPTDKPAFLFLTPRAPHAVGGAPYTGQVVESKFVGDPRCANIPKFNPPSYDYPTVPGGWGLIKICQALLTTDELVGNIEARLADRGRPTVWVFTSDNGMSWGAKGFPQKTNPFAHQMPLYITGFGQGSNNALVSNIDLAPTLAAIAGTSMPYADGESFASVLDGAVEFRDYILEDMPEAGDDNGPWHDSYTGLITHEWHMFTRPGKPTRLFNLTTDPWELQGVANAAKIAELKGLLP